MMDQNRGSFLHLRLSQAERVGLSQFTLEFGQARLLLLNGQYASDDFHAEIALRSQAGDLGAYPFRIGKRFSGLSLMLRGHLHDPVTAVGSRGRNAIQQQERCEARSRRCAARDPDPPPSLG
ncbi:MAG TPA: hypothetical protein VM487_26435 [Phycisphaerae bacterium]|nr:hypothetical protein [Phycisphaerae bacterium]